MVDTLLELDFGVAPFSARNMTESITHDDGAGDMLRTWNGELVDLSNENFRKFVVSIDGNDNLPPVFAGVWQGRVVVVKLASEDCYPPGGSPARPVVAGSERTLDGYTYYRMQLTMRVESFEKKFNEWGGSYSWSLRLREI